MTLEKLKVQLDAIKIIIFDVRIEGDWSASKLKVAGAIRDDPKAFDHWAVTNPKEKTLVLYGVLLNEGTSDDLH
jgi:hypothetical protein